MDVRLCDDAAAFVAATAAYRGGEPFRTNVLGSVATTVVEGTRSFEGARWWVVEDDGSVVGAAMRTPPHALALGPMPDPAARALAVAVAAVDDTFPSVGGPRAVVAALLDAYAATGSSGAARRPRPLRRDVLHVAGEVRAPEVAGTARTVASDELELAAAWTAAFEAEVDGTAQRPSHADLDALAATISLGRLRWWCRDGAPVSMAGHSADVVTPSGTVARVGPVYTPPGDRRHGYAAGLTAEVTRLLQARGAAVMLFADEANPTSNGVYRSIGYETIDTFERWTLREPPT